MTAIFGFLGFLLGAGLAYLAIRQSHKNDQGARGFAYHCVKGQAEENAALREWIDRLLSQRDRHLEADVLKEIDKRMRAIAKDEAVAVSITREVRRGQEERSQEATQG